jgi:DUF2946 family protein
MARANYRNQTGWRRLMGWLAAYLLVFHVGFAGAWSGHFSTLANDVGYGIALCLNGTHEPTSPAGTPADQTHGKIHCVLCAGGGSLALSSAEVPAAPQPTLASPLIPASEPAPAQSRRHSPNQSRAPPLEV